jgi:hypothetical protein
LAAQASMRASSWRSQALIAETGEWLFSTGTPSDNMEGRAREISMAGPHRYIGYRGPDRLPESPEVARGRARYPMAWRPRGGLRDRNCAGDRVDGPLAPYISGGKRAGALRGFRSSSIHANRHCCHSSHGGRRHDRGRVVAEVGGWRARHRVDRRFSLQPGDFQCADPRDRGIGRDLLRNQPVAVHPGRLG